MKNYIIISFLCFVVLGCKKDIGPILTGVEMIASQFPESYKNNESVFFINAEGERKRINTSYEVKEYVNIVDGVSKDTRLFSTILAEEGAQGPLILMSASNSGDIEDYENYNLSLNMNLWGLDSEDGLSLAIPIRDGELSLSAINHFESNLEFSITGHLYSDVHYMIKEDQDSYSELYYNAEFGVIGFRDHRNDLWVLVEG